MRWENVLSVSSLNCLLFVMCVVYVGALEFGLLLLLLAYFGVYGVLRAFYF